MNGHPQLTKDVSFRFARSNDNRDEISDSGVFLMRFGSCADALALRSLVVLALMLVWTGLQASERKELGEILKQKYKGIQVNVMVSGMYAGETQKDLFGPREAGVTWVHYHESLPMSTGKTIVDQIDNRTYSTRGIINRVGTNTFLVDKGEPLAVVGAEFGCSHKMWPAQPGLLPGFARGDLGFSAQTGARPARRLFAFRRSSHQTAVVRRGGLSRGL